MRGNRPLLRGNSNSFKFNHSFYFFNPSHFLFAGSQPVLGHRPPYLGPDGPAEGRRHRVPDLPVFVPHAAGEDVGVGESLGPGRLADTDQPVLVRVDHLGIILIKG